MTEYFPKQYLTEELMSNLVSQLELDIPYRIEEDLPDGIEVCFLNSSVYFSEYGEGEISVLFLADQLGTKQNLTLADAISVVAPNIDMADEYIIKKHIPFASQEKVSNQIKNYFDLILRFLHPFLLGDYSWVEKYKEFNKKV